MVFGMNWGYMPIGQNHTYDFWGKPDEVIIKALDAEMRWLKDMHVNVIRQYLGIPPRWITYIYEKYGIYTVINHDMGRYGMRIDDVWVNPVDYSNERFRELVKEQITELVGQYKDTPGLLMWLLGNENNYGLYWKSSEIEDLPEAKQGDARATFLYSLFGEVTDLIHSLDPNHPVSMANGDLGFLEVIKKECPNIDVLGSNVYRGMSSAVRSCTPSSAPMRSMQKPGGKIRLPRRSICDPFGRRSTSRVTARVGWGTPSAA
jgi:beta-galactosidase/beta-glucuronidase